MASSAEWKAIAAAVKTLVEEATFEANSEGLTFRAMDPSHVALVDLTLPNSSFASYECSKPFKFSLRVEDLVKTMNRSDSHDSVLLTDADPDAKEEAANEGIWVVFQNGYRRKFNIHLIESTAGAAPLPKLEYKTRASLTMKILEKVLADINVVSDQVTIQATAEKLQFTGKSDVGTAHINLAKNDADVLELHAEEESKATYSVEYLNSILRALSGTADTVQIEFSTKKPIRSEMALNSQGAKLAHFLAPRVQD